MKVHVVKPTRFLFACLAQVWLQEAIRIADHLHAEEVQKAEKKAKETAMHSMPSSRWKARSVLAFFVIFCLLLKNKSFSQMSSKNHSCSGTTTGMPPLLVKPEGTQWMSTQIAPAWDGPTAVDEGVKVKEEKTVFKALRTPPRHIIEVDTPSPAQKKRKSNLLSSTTLFPVPNPSNATLGLSHPDDEDTLERALEAEMDLSYPGFPEVGVNPEGLHDCLG